jgi:FKBP-type peptidyl-prolyl cis-trans isomerase
MNAKIIVGLLSAAILSGCGNDAEQAKPAEEKAAAAASSTNYPGEATAAQATTTASGLQYIDLVVGAGAIAEAGKNVVVHYSGYLTNGFKFDSSVDRDQAIEFPLGAGEMIKGWDEGVVGMKAGGKRKLIIPPALGYGASDYGPIPGNSVLVFDIELLEVK